jgi:catechol 2,3-dioxygenase-like lactoylglutathione lyase family enzyme
MNRINVICFGVRDMETSTRFYRDGLGFQTDEKENNPKMVFFNTSGGLPQPEGLNFHNRRSATCGKNTHLLSA